MRVKSPVRSLAKILILRAPIEAQLIVTRRCNLSCGYCTEYDHSSPSVPLQDLRARIEALHRLGVVHISLLGGEPLLHPQIAEVVAYANAHAQVSITTNGFPLSDPLIRQLSDAGLSNMQISIDTLHPDGSGYIQKSLKSMAPKLERVKRLARFDVHVNIVLCQRSSQQFVDFFGELKQLGLPVSVGLVHDEKGTLGFDGSHGLDLWERFYQEGSPISFVEYQYGKQLLRGQRPVWKCRAGARYLYVDEFGNVHFCSAQRGRPDKPIAQYTREDIRRHATQHKGCETGCSIFCVYRASQVDNAPLQLSKAMIKMLSRGVIFGDPRLRREQKKTPRPLRRPVASG